MKYKVGDRVRIKSIDWYDTNKDEDGIVELSTHIFTPGMSQFCGKVMTIEDVFEDIDDNVVYYMEEIDYDWIDEMIEGLVEEETLIERVDDNGLPFNEWLSHKGAFHIPDGYELKDENGNIINTTKIVLEKKKEYPKTYEECCKVLDFCGEYFFTTYEEGIHLPENDNIVSIHQILKSVSILTKLLICRDTYWKIAGEEMGLRKPWEPDSNSGYFIPAIIYRSGSIQKVEVQYRNAILTFPTEEMRDVFYENFKKEIEICKKLL